MVMMRSSADSRMARFNPSSHSSLGLSLPRSCLDLSVMRSRFGREGSHAQREKGPHLTGERPSKHPGNHGRIAPFARRPSLASTQQLSRAKLAGSRCLLAPLPSARIPLNSLAELEKLRIGNRAPRSGSHESGPGCNLMIKRNSRGSAGMISHTRRCIFVHIPKTGGTSVENLIWPMPRTANDLWMGFRDNYHNKYQTGGLQHLLATQIRSEVGSRSSLPTTSSAS